MGKPGLPSQHPASLVIVLVIVIIILPHADYDYDYDYDYEEDWLTGAGELVACQHDLAFHMRRDAGRLASNGVFFKPAGLYEQDKSGNGRRCVEVPEVAEPDMKYCNNRTDPNG